MRCFALVFVCVALGGPLDAGASCEPWPGEIRPLPSIADGDPFNARWALLRARELRVLAEALEETRPGVAYHLWEHVGCLDPDNSVAASKVADLGPRVRLGPRLFVIRPKPPASRRPKVDLARIDRTLGTARTELNGARFQKVLELTDEARQQLQRTLDSGAVKKRRVQLEVLEGSALLALGRSDQATESFVRALEADPNLELDPRTTSPKIRRLLTEVRAMREAETP